jgi:hypothetical protein
MQLARVGTDGETGDFKGLMLSNSGPSFFRKPGLFFTQGADRVSAPARLAACSNACRQWLYRNSLRFKCSECEPHAKAYQQR